MSLLARLGQALAERGRLGTLVHALDRGLAAVSGGRARVHAYAFIAQPLDAPAFLRSVIRPPAGGSRQLLHVRAGDALAQTLPRPQAILARRWAAGDECLAAVVQDELAGTLWLAFGHYDEDEVRCRYELLEPSLHVWDYDVWVAPRYRGGRVLARLWGAAGQRLVEAGYTHSISRVALGNVASLAVHRRMGGTVIGRAVFVSLGPLQIAFMGARPFVHLGLRRGQVPVLRLRAPTPQSDALS